MHVKYGVHTVHNVFRQCGWDKCSTNTDLITQYWYNGEIHGPHATHSSKPTTKPWTARA